MSVSKTSPLTRRNQICGHVHVRSTGAMKSMQTMLHCKCSTDEQQNPRDAGILEETSDDN